VARKSAKLAKTEMIVEIKSGIIDLGNELGVVPQEKVLVNSESFSKLNKKYGLVSVEKLFSGTRKDVTSDIYVFRFIPKVNINEIVSNYKREDSVVYAEANYSVSAQ